MSEWTKVGTIGIDAGLCWIGDPCYIIRDKQEERPKALGEKWFDFCDALEAKDKDNKHPSTYQFNYDAGHEGLGVCVHTGFGDGSYNVYVKYSDEGGWGKRVKEVKVVFIDDDEEEDDEDICPNCGSDDEYCKECVCCFDCCECGKDETETKE